MVHVKSSNYFVFRYEVICNSSYPDIMSVIINHHKMSRVNAPHEADEGTIGDFGERRTALVGNNCKGSGCVNASVEVPLGGGAASQPP